MLTGVILLVFSSSSVNAANLTTLEKFESSVTPTTAHFTRAQINRLFLKRDIGLVPDNAFTVKVKDSNTAEMTGSDATLTVNIKLDKPTELTFTSSSYFAVDMDNNPANGFDERLRLTPSDFGRTFPIRIFREPDRVSTTNRTNQLQVAFNQSNGPTIVQPYNAGQTTNTSAFDPNPNFNIWLDFRYVERDSWWNSTRKALAQTKADAWAALITNPRNYPDSSFNLTFTKLNEVTGQPDSPISLKYTGAIDDLVVIFAPSSNPFYMVSGIQASALAAPGFTANGRPITAQVVVNQQIGLTNTVLEAVFSHEFGHNLGLISTSGVVNNKYTGACTRKANGGADLDLQNFHPADGKISALTYDIDPSTPTFDQLSGPAFPLDYALLVDHGYSVSTNPCP